MSVREAENPELFARVQEQNLLRQYDLLANCIEIGLAKGQQEVTDSFEHPRCGAFLCILWALEVTMVDLVSQSAPCFDFH
jgi:hypothetical protein